MIKINNLYASIENKEILKGVNLDIKPGEIHAIMGPNGSGKSTLAYVLAGHPRYSITSGSIEFFGKDITSAKPEERAQAGMFLAFQYPLEIPGVSIANALRLAYNSIAKAQNRSHSREGGNPVGVPEFRELLEAEMVELSMPADFIDRPLNEGFSGGEKKKAEILQAAILNPKLLILDETDSGLDVDALRIVAEGINRLKAADKAILLITHYQRILKYIEPDFVHVFVDGKIERSGDKTLAEKLEETGYNSMSS